jgi:hypothetical protein
MVRMGYECQFECELPELKRTLGKLRGMMVKLIRKIECEGLE